MKTGITAATCLFLLLSLTGCGTITSPPTIKETREVFVMPPAAFLTPCSQPFDGPPLTANEAVERDVVWMLSLRACSDGRARIKRWYEGKR